jgi:putative NADH-flavin reductase
MEASTMSTIVVFGAAGTAGQRIVAEAARRGHTVVPVVRDPQGVPNVAGIPTVAGDATSQSSVSDLLAGADAVVVAIGSRTSTPWLDAARTLAHTVAALSQPRPYIVHMGGGATLTTPDGVPFLDLPGFPAQHRSPARGQAKALAFYRGDAQTAAIDWTYISPPPVHLTVGQRTGAYRTGGDQPVIDADGHAHITYEDFAVAVVDEIENKAFRGKRFTVGY